MVAASPEQLRDDALRFFREEELPASLEWVSLLSPLHLRLFSAELADAVKQATLTGNLDDLAIFLEGWEATAELDASPEILAEVKRAKRGRPLESFSS